MFNTSIRSGIFPNDWKSAKVSPVFKHDDKEDSNNHRPISVIPVISEVIERIIHNQLYDYLITNNILSKYQSGFRPPHSTLTALLGDATNEWYTNIDKGTVVYLDLTKAFDTVDHSILIKKASVIWSSNRFPEMV